MIDTPDILHGKILIVDDQKTNVQLLKRMLRAAGYLSITATQDPLEACELHRKHHYDLILLDLKMPGLDGFQVMENLKRIAPDSYLPVLVITAHPEHKLRALQAGAKDFVSIPFELAEVLARVQNLLEVRLLHTALQYHNEMLEHRVRERTAELQENYLETILTMTRAAEHKDEETGAHVQRISYYSGELAKLLGMDETFVDCISVATPMHDIGKIGIHDHVLRKPGGFTPEEWQAMREHTTMGAKILGNSKSPYLRMAAEIALNHHERWDGSGYPNGKHGEDIPLCARIMNICDIYDALRSERPYKPAYDHTRAVHIITCGDGRVQPQHFDPKILEAFRQHHQMFSNIYDKYTTATEKPQ
jgi:putative two-component system response regulator